MNIHKSLDGNKDKSINPFDLQNSLKSEKRLNNIKKLADEMVQMIIERKKLEAEEKINDDTIFYDVDVQTYKHKSQIFINRNHNKLLRNFSLTKNNEDNNNLKSINTIIRRRNKQITAQNNISYSKNKISFHFSLKNKGDFNNNDNINENINEEEKKSEENKGKSKSGFDSGEDIISKKSGEDKKNLNNQEFDSSLDYEEPENNDYDKYNMDNYEILYINPSQITPKEKEELSTKNDEDKINNNKNLDINIGKYLFEKGKKMINYRNKKINKVKEIRESKTKNFFDIKNYVKKNEKNTYTKNNFTENEKDNTYIPLHYKAGELHRFHLTKIELNQKNNFIKKELEEQKEMKKNVNKQKLNKNIWNNFLDRENQWKQNNINIRKESLKKKEKKEKDKIYDRPKINKDSIIILEQKNKYNKLKTNTNNKNYSNYISSNKYSNIYTKLYKDKEIYDKKLKQRIYNSLPTFTPKIIENKRQKSLNKNTLFTTKNNNISKINKTQNIIKFDYHKKAIKKGIYLNDDNISQKKLVTSISTKQFNLSKYSIKKEMNKNKKSKKTFVYELNINNSNFSNNNKEKSNLKKDNISSYIKKLGESAEKNFKKNKKYIYQKHFSETNLVHKNKDEHHNNENSNILKNENLEMKNKSKKNKKLEINSCTKYLYNINTAEHTSNNLKQFVVLTTKKYIDFFK